MQILIVVDDADKQRALEKHIAQQGHAALVYDNGKDAISTIADTHIDVVICSSELPDMNGSEWVEKVRRMELDRYLYIIMVFDPDRKGAVEEKLSNGVDALLTWPLDNISFVTTVTTAARIITLENEASQRYRALQQNFEQTIEAFSKLIDAFSGQLGAHCRRVGSFALSMAEMHPEISSEEYRIIEVSARLHDIGMIGLPHTVAEKKGTELSGDERELYRSHPHRGADILDRIEIFRPVARLVRSHHEQFNGRGFPDALSGENIPLGSAIICAASLYDDLIHRERVDRKAAFDHLQRYRGYQLAPRIVEMLLEINLTLQQADARKGERRCGVTDLKPDMVLSRDIIAKSGACVMSAGTRLDIIMIEKLKRYYQSGNIIDSAFTKR